MRSIFLFLLSIGLVVSRPALSRDRLDEMEFTSRGIVLSGTLVVPQDSPKAAVVLIQGAGPTPRMTRFARGIASQGFVVLTYDKRGVGISGGVYDGADNVSAANLDRLADDAAAAVAELRRRPEFQDLPIGFLGISQAGWIGPLAATKAGHLAFMAFWGGPICKVSEQLHFQDLGAPDGDPSGRRDRAAAIASMTAQGDVDPSESLVHLDIPVLWVFGDADTQVPVDLSLRNLKSLVDRGHDGFAYRLYPDTQHPALNDRTVRDVVAWLNATLARPRR